MKFIEQIKAVDMDRRTAIEADLVSITMSESKNPDYYTAREFFIGVKLGATQLIEEEVIRQSRGEVIAHATYAMKKNIVHLVYGDIKQELVTALRLVRNDSYYRDTEATKKLEAIIRSLEV